MTSITPVNIPSGLTNASDINAEFKKVLDMLGLDAADTGGKIVFTGQDPILPSKHQLGAIIAMGMMAPAVATQILYRLRGGPEQDLSVNLNEAVHQINPMYLFTPTVGGYPYTSPALAGNPLGFSLYPTKDDRWYLPTALYPKMFSDWLGLLKCELNPSSVTQAVSKWNAADLEETAAERGMIGTMCRTPEEWYAHPQGSYLSRVPMIEITKIGDSDPELPKLTEPARPLSGIKVAAMTHVIAGPVTSRTLAEQGAQILDLASPDLEVKFMVEDCHLGFRSTWSDLKLPKYREQAIRLIRDADVVVENYRGRKIANFGLSAEAVAEIRPGIIYTSVRGFGWEGPWTEHGGFDMDANCCTGYATLEGTPDAPKLPPTMILNDYLAGYLTSAGVLAALILRAKHGGSYHVRTSLSRFSMWYSQLGVFDARYLDETLQDPKHQPATPKTVQFTSAYGKQVHLAPTVIYSKTPGFWKTPGGAPIVAPLGSSDPEWV